MNLTIFLFCLIQGITEFLPISSQAHLLLFNNFFFITNENFTIRQLNILVHFGSLLAIVVYYFGDCLRLLISLKNFFRSDLDPFVRLFYAIIVATLPIIIFGFLIAKFVQVDFLHSFHLIGWTTLIFGIFLFVIDKSFLTIKNLDYLPLNTAFKIGILQAFALIPGASRSGMVIIGMRMFGYNRVGSAKFSNLLSIPAIFSAMGYMIYNSEEKIILFNFTSFFVIFFSFIFSLVFIHFMVTWIRNSSFAIFMYYRIILGIIILSIFYFDLENIGW